MSQGALLDLLRRVKPYVSVVNDTFSISDLEYVSQAEIDQAIRVIAGIQEEHPASLCGSCATKLIWLNGAYAHADMARDDHKPWAVSPWKRD